jgi:hypothetical protein
MLMIIGRVNARFLYWRVTCLFGGRAAHRALAG